MALWKKSELKWSAGHLKCSLWKAVIAFAECKTEKINDTYLFIDCSVDYAYRCQMNNVEFAKYA